MKVTSHKHMCERATRMHANKDWRGAHTHRCQQKHRSLAFESLSDSKLRATPLQAIGAGLADHRCSCGANTKVASCPSRYSGSTGCCTQGSRLLSQHSRCRYCPSAQNPRPEDQGPATSASCPMPRPQSPPSSRLMVAGDARTKPRKKSQSKKRVGAKATKKLER